jgi:hypothetical protein
VVWSTGPFSPLSSVASRGEAGLPLPCPELEAGGPFFRNGAPSPPAGWAQVSAGVEGSWLGISNWSGSLT